MPSRQTDQRSDLKTAIEAAFRGAIEGSDAYRAVRVGLRLHDEILRIGNRFVPANRFREIAFVALGNAAGSMALAAQEMLGERLSQGLSAGPVPPPATLQFRHVPVPDPWPGSPEGAQALGEALELVQGLRHDDLLLLLLSPGALSVTVAPPTGWSRDAWRTLLREVARSPVAGADPSRVARLYGGGAVAGRFGIAAGAATVATLVVERGEGGELIGGGPTAPIRTGEEISLMARLAPTPALARALGALPATPPAELPANVHRPVVVAGPADALHTAGNLLAGQGWVSRLVSLRIPGSPAAVGEAFLAGVEGLRREFAPLPARGPPERAVHRAEEAIASAAGTLADARVDPTAIPVDRRPLPRTESRGLAAFAATTFGTVEGGETEEELRGFVRAAGDLLRHREMLVGALRTAGAISGRGDVGGLWRAASPEETAGANRLLGSFALRPGLADVGTVLVALLPWPAGAPS